MAKFVGYDCFQTMRIRFTDGRVEDVAYMAEPYGDKWWQGDWESYIFNMVADMMEDGAIDFTDWESMFIAMPDWNEEGFVLHTFTIFADGDNKIYHEVKTIAE